MADFLEQSLTEDTLDEIVRLSSFSAMRESWTKAADGGHNQAMSHHMRKGCVGDWKSHFSKEQSDYVDQMFKTHFEGSGLSVDFEIWYFNEQWLDKWLKKSHAIEHLWNNQLLGYFEMRVWSLPKCETIMICS